MIAAKAKEIPFQGPLLMLIIIILTNYSTENVYIQKSLKSQGLIVAHLPLLVMRVYQLVLQL